MKSLIKLERHIKLQGKVLLFIFPQFYFHKNHTFQIHRM